jgi:hypothetical protein
MSQRYLFGKNESTGENPPFSPQKTRLKNARFSAIITIVMSSHTFSREQIDKMTFRISSLDSSQRELVRDHLHAMHDRNGGVFYKESFHRDMLELLESNQISQTDFHAIERAFFG